jgi:hypothetical protein
MGPNPISKSLRHLLTVLLFPSPFQVSLNRLVQEPVRLVGMTILLAVVVFDLDFEAIGFLHLPEKEFLQHSVVNGLLETCDDMIPVVEKRLQIGVTPPFRATFEMSKTL